MSSTTNFLVTVYDRKVKEGKATADRLRKDNGVLRLGGDTLRKKIETLNRLNGDLNKVVAELSQENKALTELLGEVQGDLVSVIAEKKSLELRVDSQVAEAKTKVEKAKAEAAKAKAEVERMKESRDRLVQLVVKSALDDLNGKYAARFERIRQNLETERKENNLHCEFNQAKGTLKCLELAMEKRGAVVPEDLFDDLQADVAQYDAKYKAFETVKLEDGDLEVIPTEFCTLPPSEDVVPKGLLGVNQFGLNIKDVTLGRAAGLKDPPNTIESTVKESALAPESAAPIAETAAPQTTELPPPASEYDLA